MLTAPDSEIVQPVIVIILKFSKFIFILLSCDVLVISWHYVGLVNTCNITLVTLSLTTSCILLKFSFFQSDKTLFQSLI